MTRMSQDHRRGYHATTPGLGYENGAVVPVTMPEADGEDAELAAVPDDVARVRREVIRRLLNFLTADEAAALAVGRRVILLVHLLGGDRAKTQRELARRLGLSFGRISQMLNALKRCIRKNDSGLA